MLKKGIVTVLLLLVTGVAPAFAQSHKMEVSGFFGWSLSDGVDGNAVLAGNGQIYDKIEPKDSGIYGFSVGALLGEGAEVGFLFSQQPSTLMVSGTSDLELGDMKINTYHGYFAYNFGEVDAKTRPFVFIGLGATNYGSVDVTTPGGRAFTTGGETQFSTTWGAGAKIYPSSNVGIRVAATWTPTYIKTDSAGWWCDPYWGCYLVGNAQYSSQFHFTGGVLVRF